MKTGFEAFRVVSGLTVVCSLLAGCGDDAPSGGGDTGRTDIAADAVIPDTPGGGDTGGTDVIAVQDTGDAGVDDVTQPDVVGTDVVGTDVVGTDAVGTDVVGTDVVGTDVVGTDGGLGGVRAHRGAALVGAGGVMTSAGFRMVSTLGQSTVHQGTMRSAGFRLQGGLAGATGGRSR